MTHAIDFTCVAAAGGGVSSEFTADHYLGFWKPQCFGCCCRWGVAGQRCVIYVEDFEGHVGVMTQIEDLEAVADSLDRRGMRELALATAIEKSYR